MEQSSLDYISGFQPLSPVFPFYQEVSVQKPMYNIFLNDNFGMETYTPKYMLTGLVDLNAGDLSFMNPWLRMMKACKIKNRNMVKRLKAAGYFNKVNHPTI